MSTTKVPESVGRVKKIYAVQWLVPGTCRGKAWLGAPEVKGGAGHCVLAGKEAALRELPAAIR
jgi:hypothetical protein